MSTELRIHVAESDGDADSAAANEVVRLVTRVVRENGRASLALSRTHDPFLAALIAADAPWQHVDLFQVDERIAETGSEDRNSTALAPLARLVGSWYPMPVDATEPLDGARRYETVLRNVTRGELDVIHLGLGPDGHTASLVPGDAALAASGRLVAQTGKYNGHRRLTLTAEALNAAHHLVWLVTGDTKAVAMRSLVAAEQSTPAGRILQDRAVVFADEAAAGIILHD